MGERLVVVGGDGAGMAAASLVRRRRPDMEIVAIERGSWTSYSACGIPYLVGGEIHRLEDLVARSPEQFRANRIDVRTGHEVTAIDLDARQVEVHNIAHGRTFRLGFDHLHLATGARPRRPGLPGLEMPHVHGVQTLDDAARLLADAERRRPSDVVVVGSGYVGLEMAEAFVARGARVTVVEQAAEVMGTLDAEIGARVSRAMRAAGIDVRTGEQLLEVDAGGVHTSGGALPAQLVVLGLGVEPNAELAVAAGLRTGVRGAVAVDRRQRTSVEGVWAAGDCCESRHLVSGQPVHEALGTVANKQGRVVGLNVTGGYATFPGVVGTGVTRLCALEIARTGLNQAQATEAGFDHTTATVEATTMASYLPDAEALTVRLIAERSSLRLLGAQIVGGRGAAKRIDVVVAALTARMSAEDLVGLDLGYAPPFSSVWDPVQQAARRLLGAAS